LCGPDARMLLTPPPAALNLRRATPYPPPFCPPSQRTKLRPFPCAVVGAGLRHRDDLPAAGDGGCDPCRHRALPHHQQAVLRHGRVPHPSVPPVLLRNDLGADCCCCHRCPCRCCFASAGARWWCCLLCSLLLLLLAADVASRRSSRCRCRGSRRQPTGARQPTRGTSNALLFLRCSFACRDDVCVDLLSVCFDDRMCGCSTRVFGTSTWASQPPAPPPA
jgi:hypothetical protein